MWRFPDRTYFTVPGNPLFLMVPTARRPCAPTYRREPQSSCQYHLLRVRRPGRFVDAYQWLLRQRPILCANPCPDSPRRGPTLSPVYLRGSRPCHIAPACTFSDVIFANCSANRGENSTHEQGYIAIGGTVAKSQQMNRGTQPPHEPW